MLRVVIADDEAPARSRLRTLLGRAGGVEIVAECADGEEALAAIARERPDAVFLDIQMPALDGLATASALSAGDAAPAVVFVTAYDEHAVRAFELRALDYLLKPVSPERLAATLERLRARTAAPAADAVAEVLRRLGGVTPAPVYTDRFAVRLRTRVYYVKTDEIDWLEADGNYVKLHTGKKHHLVRGSLSQITEELDPRRFARVHRSAAVNLDRIQELQPLYDGEYEIVLQTGARVRLSRTYRHALPGL